MKKIVKALLTLALVITCICAVSVQTKAATVANGTCGKNGDNLTWSLDNTGTLTISGIGEMCDYGYQYNTPSGSTQPWQNFPETIKKVVIGNNVTSIGAYAFMGCEELTSVTISNSVTSIGAYAFQYCYRLTSINIPDGLTSVGDHAFESVGLDFQIYDYGKYIGSSSNPYAVLIGTSDRMLTACTIHKDTRIISDAAFFNHTKLTSITIPNSITHIGNNAFRSAEKLASVTIGSSVVSIGNAAFGWCPSLTSVTIPDSVITIGDEAFRYCEGLTSIKIGNSVKTIGDEAFDRCNHVTSITLPNSVTSIGYRAFADCYMLTTVNIGENIRTIGEDAFDSQNLIYNVYSNGKYLGNEINPYVVLMEVNNTDITACDIHPDTKVIGACAFWYCTNLTSITIPDKVVFIGSYAFQNCSALTSIKIPNSVVTIDKFAFAYNSKLTSATIPDSIVSIGTGVFNGCSKLNYNVYGSGKYLGNSNNPYVALVNPTSDSITSCDIHSGTKVIGGGVFYDCASLTEVAIPDSMITIGDSVFGSCVSLKSVYYAGSREQWNKVQVGSDNADLTKAKLYVNCAGLPPFPDVKPNAWYYKAVEFAVDKGYFSGNGDGTFGPSNNITRQDFVVVLSRIAGADLSKYSGQTAFADVKSNAYYAKAIHWATANGVISGYNATKFGVGDALTREQLVTILSRYAAKKGVNVTATAAAKAKMNAYSDAGKVNPYMKDAVAWALQNKVISGMTSTTVGPQGKATRAQVAAILFNISSYKVIPGI